MLLYGGRAAEEVKLGEVTTGASNDIEQATKLARAMRITSYGMSAEFDMVAMETVTTILGGDTSLACSVAQKEIDRQVVELVKNSTKKQEKFWKKTEKNWRISAASSTKGNHHRRTVYGNSGRKEQGTQRRRRLYEKVYRIWMAGTGSRSAAE